MRVDSSVFGGWFPFFALRAEPLHPPVGPCKNGTQFFLEIACPFMQYGGDNGIVKPILPSLVVLACSLGNLASEASTTNVILISMDGVRCQEMFQGMDREIWQVQNEGKEIAETDLYRDFWADTAIERREKLMPFFWGELMKNDGAIVGNRFDGSVMKLSNRHRFSSPGYSEILTGEAHDDVIDSNSKIQNPFPTVMEYLRKQLSLPSKSVASFASWEAIDFVVEKDKGAIFSNAGFEAYEHDDPMIQLLSHQQFETATPWDSVRHDTYTFRFAMAHLKTHRPRVLYVSLGETDDWAHEKRYDRVLQAIHRSDEYFRELWSWLQAQDDYRDQTTVFFATDHGRGDNAYSWPNHGDKIDGAEFVWFAAAGAGVTKRGELAVEHELGQNQIAATLCRPFDLDFQSEYPAAGAPMTLFFAE